MDQTEIDAIIIIEEQIFLPLAGDLLRGIVGVLRIPTENYHQGDRIDQILDDLVSSHSPKYESNNNVKKIGKTNVEDGPVRDRYSLLKKNDDVRRKARVELNKSVCSGKEKNLHAKEKNWRGKNRN